MTGLGESEAQEEVDRIEYIQVDSEAKIYRIYRILILSIALHN
jgi:hypothetical protein